MTEARLTRSSDTVADPDSPARSKPMLRDIAYGRFMELLLNGQLKPGLLVSQRELCARTDCTIGAMREALKRLEAESFVTLIPQRGVMVCEVDHKELVETYEFRKLIEIPAIRSYSRQVDHAFLAEMRRQTKEIIARRPATSAENERNVRERMAIDEKLHLVIVGALGNGMVDAAYRKLSNQLRLSRLSLQPRFADSVPAMKEHLRIIDALEQEDPDAAVAAMTDHLDTSLRRAIGLD